MHPPISPPRHTSVDAVWTRVLAGALGLVAVLALGACQKETPMTDPRVNQSQSAGPSGTPAGTASDCDVKPGDVSVLRGGTFPIDAAATIRAGLQFEVSADPRTWKVMFLADGTSTSHDLKRGDTVTVAGRTVTVRDACADRVVLTLGDASS